MQVELTQEELIEVRVALRKHIATMAGIVERAKDEHQKDVFRRAIKHSDDALRKVVSERARDIRAKKAS